MSESSNTNPLDRFWTPIRLSVTSQHDDILLIQHRPDFALPLLGVGVSLAAAVMLWFTDPSLVLYPLIALAAIGYVCLTQHELSCTVNKTTGLVSYQQGGILTSHIGERSEQHSTDEVAGIEMKRHIRRGGDTFQIRLALKTGRKLNLSADNLNFRECQAFAERIQIFLGVETPTKAVD